MMISSDGITRDISEEEAVLWQPRKLDELASAVPTLEEKLATATSSGYQQGYEDALAESGKKETVQIAKINELLRYLGQPLASVDETLKQSLLSLAAEMASHIVEREVGSDLEYYRTQLDQLSDRLPAQVRVTSLRLRPEKALELRKMRDAAEGATDLLPEIIDDTELAGDVCLACWQESAVDISLRDRLASIVQSYCGDNSSEALVAQVETVADEQTSVDQAQVDQNVDTQVTPDSVSTKQDSAQPLEGLTVDSADETGSSDVDQQQV